jgi:hypothetical protein
MENKSVVLKEESIRDLINLLRKLGLKSVWSRSFIDYYYIRAYRIRCSKKF